MNFNRKSCAATRRTVCDLVYIQISKQAAIPWSGSFKGTLATQNVSRKSSGDKSKEVRGQNLPFCFKGKFAHKTD